MADFSPCRPATRKAATARSCASPRRAADPSWLLRRALLRTRDPWADRFETCPSLNCQPWKLRRVMCDVAYRVLRVGECDMVHAPMVSPNLSRRTRRREATQSVFPAYD